MRKELKEQLEALQQEQSGQAVVVQPEPVVYTHVAMSMGKDPVTQRWTLIEIPYNITTGQVGPLKKTDEDDRGVCEEHFKIEVVNRVFLREAV